MSTPNDEILIQAQIDTAPTTKLRLKHEKRLKRARWVNKVLAIGREAIKRK